MLTVITKADSYDLTTLATVKDDMGIADGSSDAFLSRAIGQASEFASKYCGRVFGRETVTETIDRPVRVVPFDTLPPALILTRRPVVSVASVTECGIVLSAGDYEVEDADAGFLGRLNADGRPRLWPAGRIVVSYVAGYVLPGAAGTTLPADLEGAVIDLVRSRFYARSRDPSVKSENVPGVLETTYWVGQIGDGALPSDVQAILDHYKSPALA